MFLKSAPQCFSIFLTNSKPKLLTGKQRSLFCFSRKTLHFLLFLHTFKVANFTFLTRWSKAMIGLFTKQVSSSNLTENEDVFLCGCTFLASTSVGGWVGPNLPLVQLVTQFWGRNVAFHVSPTPNSPLSLTLIMMISDLFQGGLHKGRSLSEDILRENNAAQQVL